MQLNKDILGLIMWHRCILMIKEREHRCAFMIETDEGISFHDMGDRSYILLREAGTNRVRRVSDTAMQEIISGFWKSYRRRGHFSEQTQLKQCL